MSKPPIELRSLTGPQLIGLDEDLDEIAGVSRREFTEERLVITDNHHSLPCNAICKPGEVEDCINYGPKCKKSRRTAIIE